MLLALTSVTALAQTYTDKDTVKAVQEALNAAGYPCGVADGIAAYCARHGFQCVRDIVGAAHPKEKTT